MSQVMERWHKLLDNHNEAALRDLLADDVTFHSPVVHTPQEGKEITVAYLMAAQMVLGGDTFQYVREIIGQNDAMLEFTVEVDGILINGVDIIKWNDEDKIIDFKVMLRPLKAINLIHQMMGQQLAAN
jgi:SnoaL-like domain